MAKRTLKQIENDYLFIKKYVNEHTSVTSIKEIANGVELTEVKVRTSLEKHPRVYAKVKQLINENKEAIKSKKEAEKSKIESNKTTKKTNLKAKKESGFVIDASITGIENLYDILNEILFSESKIVLTSITIQELDKMQKFNDTDGIDARKILGMAAENPEGFYCVQIDETAETHDDCIIKYCADNKENVILLTSDKTMALKARIYGVKTRFLKQTIITPSNFTYNNAGLKVYTLYAARKFEGTLCISTFTTDYRSILVLSNGMEYKDGVYELNMGDDVYVSTKKDGYLTFAHYHIISLEAKNNCTLTFSKRVHNATEISDLPLASYKAFMREFRCKVDF